jgi:hypothetical protein
MRKAQAIRVESEITGPAAQAQRTNVSKWPICVTVQW